MKTSIIRKKKEKIKLKDIKKLKNLKSVNYYNQYIFLYILKKIFNFKNLKTLIFPSYINMTY